MDQSAIPEHIRDLPQQVQLAVLYERVQNLGEEVKGLKRSLWAFVFSILGGALLFLLSVAVGWLGPHSGAAHGAIDWLLGQ